MSSADMNGTTEDPCELCIGTGPPVSREYLALLADLEGGRQADTSLDEIADIPDQVTWIGCSKCDGWYHGVCVLLKDKEMAKTVPEEIRTYLSTTKFGPWRDWTKWAGKWHCAKCLKWAADPSNPRPPRAPLVNTVNTKTFPPKPRRQSSIHKPLQRSASLASLGGDTVDGGIEDRPSSAKRRKVGTANENDQRRLTDEIVAIPPTRPQALQSLSNGNHGGSNGFHAVNHANARGYGSVNGSYTSSFASIYPGPSTVTYQRSVTPEAPTFLAGQAELPSHRTSVASTIGVAPRSGKEPSPEPNPAIETSFLAVESIEAAPRLNGINGTHRGEPFRATSADAAATPATAETPAATSPTISSTLETPLSGLSRPKRQVALNRPDYHALHHHIATPTARWLDLIANPEKYNTVIKPDNFPRLPGSLLCKEWVESPVGGGSFVTRDTITRQAAQNGSLQCPPQYPPTLFYGDERVPIVITPENGGFESLGGRLPSKNLTVADIARLVGPDRGVPVIDVNSQQSNEWTLSKWADYVQTRSQPQCDPTAGHSGKAYNIISLEISGTELGKMVKPPRLVTEIDWVDNHWHWGPGGRAAAYAREAVALGQAPEVKPELTNGDGKGKKKPQLWPKVQLYCLMGTKNSWTDWHIDFAASSVYYTILKGAKTFFFIRPTEKNLAAYAEWSGSYEKQQNTWLGDMCDEVRSVTLNEGDTMILPAGYIHAVHTPKDSIVFGGNFLHSYDIPTQLKLRQIEIDTKVPQIFRFPHLDKLLWYVADKYCSDLRSLRSYRIRSSNPPKMITLSPRVLEGLSVLSAFLIKQTDILEDSSAEDRPRKFVHDRVPYEAVKDPSGLAHELQWRVQRELPDHLRETPKSDVKASIKAEAPPKNGKKVKDVWNARDKSRARMWNFEPTTWEEVKFPVGVQIRTIDAPRPSTPVDVQASSAEQKQTVHKQSKSRQRESDDGGIIIEEQELLYTETITIWPGNARTMTTRNQTIEVVGANGGS